MTPERFDAITSQYGRLALAVAGDFCLDRYLEIDPAREEVSIETGLTVHNIARVRSQPGGAGTILNNLVALGVPVIYPLGFAGEDGEGYELMRALGGLPGVRLDYFIQTSGRATFTYCKPLVVAPGQIPRELNRLDRKNWTATPPALTSRIIGGLTNLVDQSDALILLSQVDRLDTGVLTSGVLAALSVLTRANPARLLVADSRTGLRGFPPVVFKMNGAELTAMTGVNISAELPEITAAASEVARGTGRPVFVTLAQCGMVGASPDGNAAHVPAIPLRGEIDIVGAGDSVTANLTVALAAGATIREALEIANAAASIVIHQLGTTGAAMVPEIRELLFHR